jgi:hypothetical protein
MQEALLPPPPLRYFATGKIVKKQAAGLVFGLITIIFITL